MFLDWYVRFRRIDEWPETMAIVMDSVFIPGSDGGEGKSQDGRRFSYTYRDRDGGIHHGTVTAFEGSELFPLDPGDQFPLRYNPEKANKSFVAGAHEDSLFLDLLATVLIVGLIAALTGYFVRR